MEMKQVVKKEEGGFKLILKLLKCLSGGQWKQWTNHNRVVQLTNQSRLGFIRSQRLRGGAAAMDSLRTEMSSLNRALARWPSGLPTYQPPRWLRCTGLDSRWVRSPWKVSVGVPQRNTTMMPSESTLIQLPNNERGGVEGR
ncbi:unnamed protein product [Pleuronectes platessa]|uniref:Uncharacterized protein n=1 Tax=Pleuronectes platessa TaxID=8262 RepID=A0A9N7V8X8_PLEPL|nr:unnamed protein product [Pleuronectes platessa]